jgi:transcriptional regulator with XRE-family HTH domain
VHPTQPDQGEFARLLASIQERAGLSYQQVADAAGVNRSQAWRWINARSAPGYEHVRRLAAHLVAAYPQLADDAAALLPAAGYQTPPVTAEPAPSPATPEPPRETEDADADAMTSAVIVAALPADERRVWAGIRRAIEATPAGRALFTQSAQVAAWPENSAPIGLTDEARDILDSTPPGMLFAHPLEATAWRMDTLPHGRRVQMIAAFRALSRPPRAARRAGLRKPDGLTA